MRQLIEKLNYYTKLYNEGKPEISDKDWDKLYFRLVEMEKETGITYPDSPTQSIYYADLDKLNKVKHSHPMLSLEKTKSAEEIKLFMGNKQCVVMGKMDGLTCSLTYENGLLIKAETRGNGIEGEDILHNALVVRNLPRSITASGTVVIDGEIICDLKTFTEQFEGEYKNPRNFAAGSIRLLNSYESSSRLLSFVAWDWIEGANESTMSGRLDYLKENGFTVVPWEFIDKNHLDVMSEVEAACENRDFPIDGLVVRYNDLGYGLSLGNTEHHFKHSIAFKFHDDDYETELINIEWTMGRTGILTPVAIFNPIDIDGSIVERASLHNISIMKDLLGEQPYRNQKVWVFKSNMIIPQISKSEKLSGKREEGMRSVFTIPEICPICSQPVKIVCENESEMLVCKNIDCAGQFINRLDHFCGKKGLDIKGLSKATLDKLVEWNWVQSYEDLFNLTEFQPDWVKKPGFGAKSVHNILASIEASRHCDLDKFIVSLGIPLVGSKISKELCKYFNTWEKFREAIENNYSFYNLDGFGEVLHYNIIGFDYREADILAKDYIIFSKKEENNDIVSNELLKGLNIVITGKLHHFKNRGELQTAIENVGGKVVSSVSKNTSILINNDNTSTSSKNLSAKKLGIPIMTEEEFLKKYF